MSEVNEKIEAIVWKHLVPVWKPIEVKLELADARNLHAAVCNAVTEAWQQAQAEERERSRLELAVIEAAKRVVLYDADRVQFSYVYDLFCDAVDALNAGKEDGDE